MENNTETRQWMAQMEKTSRQQVRWARMQCLFSLIAALCCGAVLLAVLTVVPRIQEIGEQVQDLAGQAETVLTNLETVTSELAEVDLEGMISDVDTLVANSQEGVEQALETLNSLDIATLNDAIADLAAVVKPLADFFGRFG